MSAQVYAGPLARCRIERVPVERRGCVKVTCERYRRAVHDARADFCQTCGFALGHYVDPASTRERVSHRDALENENLWSCSAPSGEYRNFFPNRRASRQFGCDPYEDTIDVEVKTGSVAQELLWFANAYAGDIQKLRELYGEDNVTIEWRVTWAGDE